MSWHHIRKTVWRALAACGLLLLSSPLAGQENPFTIIPLDLNTRIARGTLPFKVPFYLVGPAPAGAQMIAVRYRPASSATVTCTDTVGWAEPPATSWLRAEKSDTFYVSMPELSPNRRYTLCVLSTVRPVGDALTAFRADAAAVLDEQLRRLRPDTLPNPLDADDQRAIKVAFVKALGARTGRTVVTDRNGTVFDTTSKTLPVSHGATLSNIIREHNARFEDVQAFGLTPRDAPTEPDFVHLLKNASLSGVATALTAAKQVPGMSAGEKADAAETALYLRDLDLSILPELLRGETRADPGAPRSTPMVAVADVWAPEDLAPRLDNLEFTAGRLRNLRTALSSLRSDPALLLQAGLTPGRADSLFESVHELVFAVEKQVVTVLSLRRHVMERARLIQVAAAGATAEAQRDVRLEGSSIVDFQSRAKSLISADLGLAAVYGVGLVPYLGANFYFEPINKAVPLRYRGAAGDRVSLTLGITAQSIARPGEREDLFGRVGFLAGAGLRFADPVRLTAGGVLLREPPRNPLANRRPVRVSPFLSLSLDWDVRGTLGAIADKLF